MATGDFRYDPSMFVDSPLSSSGLEIDTCYLDNTYFNRQFSNMPTRDQAFREIVKLIERKRDCKCQNLIMFRIKLKYLGKEDLLIELSEYFQTRILLHERRYNRYMKAIELNEKYFTKTFEVNSSSGVGTFIFVEDFEENLNDVNQLAEYFRHKKIITIEPTGLSILHDKSQSDNNEQTHFYVPYSDHSSFNEIVQFVKRLRPKRVFPIVRHYLPKGIDTTDISELNSLCSEKKLIDATDKYRMILQSNTSTRSNSRLNNYNLRNSSNRVPTPFNNRFINMRRLKKKRDRPKQIDYDNTPEKENSHELNVTPTTTNTTTTLVEVDTSCLQRKILNLTPEKKYNYAYKFKKNIPQLEPISEEESNMSSSTLFSSSSEFESPIAKRTQQSEWIQVNELVEMSYVDTFRFSPSLQTNHQMKNICNQTNDTDLAKNVTKKLGYEKISRPIETSTQLPNALVNIDDSSGLNTSLDELLKTSSKAVQKSKLTCEIDNEKKHSESIYNGQEIELENASDPIAANHESEIKEYEIIIECTVKDSIEKVAGIASNGMSSNLIDLSTSMNSKNQYTKRKSASNDPNKINLHESWHLLDILETSLKRMKFMKHCDDMRETNKFIRECFENMFNY